MNEFTADRARRLADKCLRKYQDKVVLYEKHADDMKMDIAFLLTLAKNYAHLSAPEAIKAVQSMGNPPKERAFVVEVFFEVLREGY